MNDCAATPHEPNAELGSIGAFFRDSLSTLHFSGALDPRTICSGSAAVPRRVTLLGTFGGITSFHDRAPWTIPLVLCLDLPQDERNRTERLGDFFASHRNPTSDQHLPEPEIKLDLAK